VNDVAHRYALIAPFDILRILWFENTSLSLVGRDQYKRTYRDRAPRIDYSISNTSHLLKFQPIVYHSTDQCNDIRCFPSFGKADLRNLVFRHGLTWLRVTFRRANFREQLMNLDHQMRVC